MVVFSEEQVMMRQLAEEFAANEMAPRAAELDETSEFPIDTLRKMGELGLLGIQYDEAYGGSGMNMLAFSLAMEAFGAACGATTLSVAAHTSLCCNPIYSFGSEAQKKKYLPPLFAGKHIGSFCLSEPNSGSDAGAMITRAEADGDGFVLSGNKQWVTNGGYADTFVVFAKTDPDAGTRGISAFIVEKTMPGVSIGQKEDKMGLRASDTRQIAFENVRLGAEQLLGEKNKGFKIALKTLDGGRIGIGAMSVGLGRASLEHATRYAKEREAFGKKIGDFQAISWYIAEMATELEAGRLLVHQAASLYDAGKPFSKQAAMAKMFASEAAMRAANKGIQTLGGYGYSRDYPLERIFRDTKLMEIGEGTSEVQRIVISKLVKEEIV